jgi:hypothetical protein
MRRLIRNSRFRPGSLRIVEAGASRKGMSVIIADSLEPASRGGMAQTAK